MKKLLCFLVMLAMVLAVFSITSFATTVEKTVWTQGFEKDADLGLNNNKTGTYANGARYHSNGSAWTKQTGIKTENGDSYFYGTHFKAGYGGRYKVYVDQSKFEEGSTYKITANVKYVLGEAYISSASTYPTLDVTIAMTDSTSIDHSGTIAENTKTVNTLTLNVETNISTKAFVYNKSNYVDDEINPFFMFSAVSVDDNVKAIEVDDVKIVKISDETIFNTSADAGYYEEGDGVIAFGAETLYGKDDATGFGMYIYRNNLGESEKVELKSSDISVFKENDGKFYATVTNIPSEYFGEKVACKPYIVVDSKVIFGDVLTYSVNDGNKYLGAKGE